ncbi:MAG: hypothetical protein K2Q23_14155 [Bryobacteraceae bacterium]|nr:hypothetical protein [Bryobacteraceae bacterium]
MNATKPGFLYVLVHPSDPELYKIGVTILEPEERLAQHNSQHDKHAGQVVKETGQKWEIKTYIAVPDPYWAEKAFWGATHFSVIPNLGGVEVQKMEWRLVEKALDAAKRAGMRPEPPARRVRNADWMQEQLEGTGITVVGRYRGLVTGTEFQCEQGHVFKESPSLVANRKSCPCCVDWNWLRGPRAGLRASLKRNDAAGAS